MSAIHSTAPNSFAIASDVETQILMSGAEDQKISKSTISDRSKILQKDRQEHMKNLEERIKQMAHGHGGCLKFLKVVSMVVGAIAAPISMGSTAALSAGLMAAMQVTTAVAGALGALTSGLDQLKQAAQAKKILLNQAEGQQILSLIDEAQKWIEDEKSHTQENQRQENESLDQYKATLKDLEQSFQTMINV